MANELKTRIQLRHDTEENWTSVKDSFIPLVGEACLTTDGENKGEALGVVKSTTSENGVSITGDGTMIVNNINIEKITQTLGTELILNGGDATVSE